MKPTVIAVDSISLYSTSASAKAVFSTGDHITGLEPLYKLPFSINLPISLTICASASKLIVKYLLSQSARTNNLLKSSIWAPIHLSAKFLHSALKSAIGISSLLIPFFL